MLKRTISLVLVLSFFACPVLIAQAGQHAGCGYSKGHGSGCMIEDKFYKKIEMVMNNSDELGLTDAQIDQIKDLKIATKKGIIRKKAEIDVLKLDLKAELYNDTIDIGNMDMLLDKMTGTMNQKMKNIVAAYAKLKNEILTKDQKDKLSDLYKNMKSWKNCKK